MHVFNYTFEKWKKRKVARRFVRLAPRFRCPHMYRLVVQHVLAFGNVTLGGGLVESSLAMGTLNVIAIIADRRGRQVAQLPTSGQVRLHLLGRAYGFDKVFVFTTPIRLYLRFL